jgi:DNA-binding LytR/AlgR family response regulator
MMSELHYVRVVTSKGETLVLHNLKDAIAQLPTEYSGIQTHRSYWAASKHIESIKEKNGQSSVVLSMDKTIPVSRRKLAEVREFLATQPERS